MRISDWSSDVCSSDLHRSDQTADAGEIALPDRVSGIARQRRAHDRVDFGLELEPLGDLERGGAMMGEARMERAKAADRHIGIVRRYRPAGLVARGREQLGGVPLGRGESHEHVRMARSEEHTSELRSLMRISYAVFCLKKKTRTHLN